MENIQKKGRKNHWLASPTIEDARTFIGIVVYYRIFIVSFAVIAVPIFELFRKDVKFSWSQERQNAMDELKRRLTEAPVLITLDFSASVLMFILIVDAGCDVPAMGMVGR